MAPIKQTLFSLYRWIKNPIKGPEKRKDDSKMDTNPIKKPMQDLEKCYHKICYWLSSVNAKCTCIYMYPA